MTRTALWRTRCTATRCSVALSSVLLVALVAVPAAAQSAAASTESPEVEKLVASSITLRDGGKDLQAREVLEKAAQLAPSSVRVQVHLSNVYQALGEWLLADRYLRLALAREKDPYVLRHRNALDDARSVIADNLGTLAVEGEPAGAEVRLNGRLVGTLPLAAPVPVTVGSYTLEVRLSGHYTASRPIVIGGRDFVRESVRLERRPANESRDAAPALAGVAGAGGDATLDRPPNRPWLTWTLAGLGTAAGVTALGAVVYREVHAKRWNDNSRCLSTEQTRAELCGAERDKVEASDALALTTGIAAGLFGIGALVNAFAFSEEEPAAPRAGLEGCTFGLGGASCFGSF
jgi:PEGA domain